MDKKYCAIFHPLQKYITLASGGVKYSLQSGDNILKPLATGKKTETKFVLYQYINFVKISKVRNIKQLCRTLLGTKHKEIMVLLLSAGLA